MDRGHKAESGVSISGITSQISSFYKKLSKKAKTWIIILLAIIIVFSIIISIIINNTKYTVLYSGLSEAEKSELYTVLQEMAVDVKVDDSGKLLVPTSQEATLKMQLASEGYPKSTLNYDIFTGSSDLLTTDYEKRQLLVFQLQNRLQDSIKTLNGVNNAIVNLSMPEKNSYVLKGDEVPITASVILELFANADLTSKQISGIQQLVANSVPGLSGDNVAIINQKGEQLNIKTSEQGTDSASLKVETVNIINSIFEQKIRDFLKPVFGDNGMSVAVNVLVDFSKVSSQETVYTPVIGDNGIISWVKRTGQTSGEPDGASGVPGTGSNTDVPTYEESAETESGGKKVNSSDTFSAEYLVNQLVKTIQDSGGNIKGMTVAVIINSDELSEETKKKYIELIAYCSGIEKDKVVLTNAPFLDISDVSFPAEKSAKGLSALLGLSDGVEGIGIILVIGLAVLLILLIAIVVITSSSRKRKKRKKSEDDFIASLEKKQVYENMPGEIVLNETREQALKRQIKEFSDSNPETVAQLLRVWIKEDENS